MNLRNFLLAVCTLCVSLHLNPSIAAPVVGVSAMKANGAPLTASGSVDGIVTVFGYAHDGLVAPSRVNVSFRNGATTSVATARAVYDPKAFESAAQAWPDILTSSNATALARAGWVAVLDTASLGSGQWSLDSVQVTFGASTTTIPSSSLGGTTSSNAWTFATQGGGVTAGMRDVTLVAQPPLNGAFSTTLPPGFSIQTPSDGSVGLPTISLPVVPLASSGLDARKYVSRGYPAVPSGAYKMYLPGVNIYGVVTSREIGVPFTYVRPTQTAYVDAPIVNDSTYDPANGVSAPLGMINPYTGEPISGELQVRNTTVAGSTLTVPFDAGTRAHQFTIDPQGPSQQTFWLQLPDAPDVVLTRRQWNPAEAFAPAWVANKTYVADIETAQFPFTWNASKAGGCASPLFLASTGSELQLSEVVPMPTAKNRVYCSVRWNSPVAPLALNRYKALEGKLPLAANGQSLNYDLGIVYFNRAAQAWRFASSDNKNLQLSVVDQSEPVAAFTADYSVRALRANSAGLVSFVGTSKLAGALNLVGNVTSADFTAQVVGENRKTVSQRAKASVPILTTTSASGEAEHVTVDAWWNDTPDRKYSYDLDFTAIPAEPTLTLLRVEGLLTTSTPTFIVRFGQHQRDGSTTYEATRDGAWTFVAQRFDTTALVWRDLGAVDSSQVSQAGGLSIPTSDALVKGQHKVRVAARLANNSAYTKEVFASSMFVVVNDGSRITANLLATPDNGPASVDRPLLVRLYAQLSNRIRVVDVKAVAWEQSDDEGATWSTVPGASTGLTASVTLSSSVDRLYRATLASRYVNDTFTTSPTRVTTFTPPATTIVGPKATVLGSGPVNYTAQVDPSAGEVTYSWTATGDWAGASAQQISGSETTFTFTPARVGSYTVKLVTKQVDAPEQDTRAITTRQIVLTVVAPTLAVPRIESPGQSAYEVGKSYTLRAHMPVLPSSLQSFANKVRMAWVTPQGDVVAAADNSTLAVQFNAVGQRVVLRAWLEGSESVVTTSSFVPTLWQYNFPEYTLTSTSNGLDAPALLQVTAKPTSAPRLDNGTTLTVTWQLPSGATLVTNDGLTASIRLANVGSNTVTARIADSRGNERISSLTVEVLPAKVLNFVITNVSQSDAYGRAPFTATMRVNVLAVPKDDPIVSVQTALDGVVQFSGGYSGASAYGVRVNSAGAHTATLTLQTRSGVTKTVSQSLQAIEPPVPVCTIAFTTDFRGDRTYTGTCTVAVGPAPGLKWILNNNPFPTAYGSRLSIAKAQISGIAKITLLAETDVGQRATFDWTP